MGKLYFKSWEAGTKALFFDTCFSVEEARESVKLITKGSFSDGNGITYFDMGGDAGFFFFVPDGLGIYVDANS